MVILSAAADSENQVNEDKGCVSKKEKVGRKRHTFEVV